MFCKSCGKQIDNDSTFCSFCGTKQKVEQPTVLISVSQPTEINKPILDNTVRQTKYDLTYKREEDALVGGIIFLIVALIFVVVGPIKFEDRESLGQFKAFSAIVSLIFRIAITIWVVGIAKRQNRETGSWGIFAFLLPSIALIVIACQKKIIPKIIISDGLNNEQNSEILADKANDFLNQDKISESIRFAEKSLELNPTNPTANKVLAKTNEFISAQKDFKNNIQTGYRNTTNNIRLKVVSSRHEIIGAEVFIDELLAPDDSYIYKHLGTTYKIQTQNGKIVKNVYITNYKSFYIEQQKDDCASVGDKVFTLEGQTLSSGKYNMGFMSSSMLVEDGVIKKFI